MLMRRMAWIFFEQCVVLVGEGSDVLVAQREAKWRRGWDSNPRYACTHNGFRDRPDRPLWHLSRATLIRGRFPPGNRRKLRRQRPVLLPKSRVSGVDLGRSLRIFRP